MHDPASRGVARLALTPEQVKAVQLPMAVLVGSSDPVRGRHIEPLLAMRRDWPVIEIPGANHDNCFQKFEFRDERARWLDRIWLNGTFEEALKLQKPQPDGAIVIRPD